MSAFLFSAVTQLRTKAKTQGLLFDKFFKIMPSIDPEGVNHAYTQSILNYKQISSSIIYNGTELETLFKYPTTGETLNSIQTAITQLS